LPHPAQVSNLPAVKVHRAFLIVIAASTACRGAPETNSVREAFASLPRGIESGTSVVFRIPAVGSQVRLYRLPDLDEISWRFETTRYRTTGVVGFAGNADLILTLVAGDSVGQDLVALDLISGRSRAIDSNVVAATIGPAGTTYLLHTDGSVAEVEQRRAVPWPDTLVEAERVWGAARGRLVAATGAGENRELVTLGRGQTPVRQPLPVGELVLSRWGRLAVVATDSGLAMFQPDDPAGFSFMPLSPHPQMPVISPSGHRIYALLGTQELVAVGRFERTVQHRSQLPSQVGAIRMDPLGRVLLVRAATADSVWIVDAASLQVAATVQSTWAEDLPTVAPDGTVLLGQDGALAAFDWERATIISSVAAREDDLWLVAGWDPHRPALELTANQQAAEQQGGQLLYVQVSSSGNVAWAEDLAQELRAAGLDATVLQPDSIEERYRVVLGPYTNREEAEDNGRRLGRPFWILTRDTIPPLQ